MTKKVLSVTLLTAVAVVVLVIAISFPKSPANVAYAQVGPGSYSIISLQNSGDPCANPNVAKASAAISISSATTTELVPAVTGKTVYVCAYQISAVGTAPTAKFETGTKVSTACDTNPANSTGALSVPTGTTITSPSTGLDLFNGAAAGEMCLVSAGTITSVTGFLTYVQQ